MRKDRKKYAFSIVNLKQRDGVDVEASYGLKRLYEGHDKDILWPSGGCIDTVVQQKISLDEFECLAREASRRSGDGR